MMPESKDLVSPAQKTALSGVPHGAVPLVLAGLLHGRVPGLPHARKLIHVCVNDRAMDALYSTLSFFAPEARILRFPAWDCLPYDRVSPRAALVAERMQTLAQLAAFADDGWPMTEDTKEASAIRHRPSVILLTTVSAILQKLPPRTVLQKASLSLEAGRPMKRERLEEFLRENGYRRAGKAIESGEYALRGSIVDIIPPGETGGIRLDFFGDDIESLRSFDPMTQTSSGTVQKLTLHPAGEALASEERIAQFRTAYRERFGAVSKDDPLYDAVSSGQHYPGMEHWLPLFFDRLDTLADYLPDALLTFEADAEKAIGERQETIADYYAARQAAIKNKAPGAPYHPLPPEMLYLMDDGWQSLLDSRPNAWITPFHTPEDVDAVTAINWRTAPNFVSERAQSDTTPFAQLKDFSRARRTEGKSTVLAALSPGSAERLQHLFSQHEAHLVHVDSWDEVKTVTGKSIGLAVLPLERGFETDACALVTEQDLLGERIIRARARKKTTANFLAEAATFQEGELVVHRDHGIGRFDGLETLEVTGARHDCLKITYADDDRLFLPVENIELLSRYGSDDEGAKLDKLGAASWQARKSKLKERIKIAAEALMKTAAERLVKTAPTLEPPLNRYEAFSEGFGYVETEDQARSIEEVLEDLTLGRPMDRLICGDVGFGKTEVALRAAFAAVFSDGGCQMTDDEETASPSAIRHPSSNQRHQVALIVPTTLLARQHYRNFATRFEGFGVRVAQLSRMVGAAEQKKVKEGLADGSIDIVIGTHALLSKSIQFANLALLIIDEEQHFGVGQKEKLKELKSNVHVLTLSATPIPRTLQLAMSGVRSLSLITTPPVDRLAVRSFVMPFDPVIIREAILREKHRGGRTFFVTPRIKDIAELKQQLAELLPEVKIAVAHGQLTPTELDTIMTDFYEGKFDLLLSTAIVESGLDIPQANTLIINRAERFGLSQLYQLRGRVGRGKIRAYAYFLLPHRRELTATATRRLEVMQSLDALGAGFTLASHDMDIRGFGNLVGEEQSGHIREVGIELYQHMLEEAVNALKADSRNQITDDKNATRHPSSGIAEDFSPQISLGMSVLIPEEYVEDLGLRMGLYRRAAMLATPDELDAFSAELTDRFGPQPEEVRHLLETVRLKQLCRDAGIARIDAGPKGAVLSFHLDRFAQPERLLAYINKHPTTLKLRPDQKLVYLKEWKDEAARLKDVSKLLTDVASLKS